MNQYPLEYGPCYTRVQGRLFVTIEVPPPPSYYLSPVSSISEPIGITLPPPQLLAGSWPQFPMSTMAEAASVPAMGTPMPGQEASFDLPLAGPDHFALLSGNLTSDVLGDWHSPDSLESAGNVSRPPFSESPPPALGDFSSPMPLGIVPCSQGVIDPLTSDNSRNAASTPHPPPPKSMGTPNSSSPWPPMATPTPSRQNSSSRASRSPSE